MKRKNTTACVTACLCAALFCVSTLTRAHVVLAEPTAATGSYYRAAFKVGHGCEGAATIAIAITIPDGFSNVKPMPKAGWTLDIKKQKLAKPIESHGKTITEEVREIEWRGGSLPDEHYDEFVMAMKLPDAAGKQYFKVSQRCTKGSNEWTEIPAPGKSRGDYKKPAAELDVLPPEQNITPQRGGVHKH
jgi:periplasmic copper chaperone A